MINTQPKQTRIGKSSRYPTIDLQFAIKVVEEARKFGRSVTNSHLAGEGSVESGAFRQKRASLGYYGLIAGREDNIQITDNAEAILNPINEIEKEEAIKNAFLSPEIFKRIYDSVEKNKPISLATLGSLVIREYGIPVNAKNNFLNTYIKAGIFAKLIHYGNDKTEIVFLPLIIDAVTASKAVTSASSIEPAANFEAGPRLESHWVDLALDNGKKARLIVPNELTENDKKKLIAQMKLLTGIFD